MNTINSTVSTYQDIRSLARPEDWQLFDALHQLILSTHKTPHVLVWPRQKIISYGVGAKKMSQHYAYLGVQASYINLGFYHGTSLSDPSKMLEGTGNSLRHIKIRDMSRIKSKELIKLINLAKTDRMPFASET